MARWSWARRARWCGRLTPADAAMLARGSQHYVENWKRFKAGLVATLMADI